MKRLILKMWGRDLIRTEPMDLPPPPMVVDHMCKVKHCVNPDHLRFVEQKDNCGKYANPTPHYINATKTHCIRGHEFTPENTKTLKTGGRVCIACYRLRGSKAYRDARRSAQI
jgi:hypothetical protein